MGTLRNRHPFTLIELLVVVAIIGVLASMLLPALSRARDMARRATCLSNQKQLYLGGALYAEDFADRLPAAGGSPTRVASIRFRDYLGLHTFIREYMNTPLNFVSATDARFVAPAYGKPFRCPANRQAKTGARATYMSLDQSSDYSFPGFGPVDYVDGAKSFGSPLLTRVGQVSRSGAPATFITDYVFVTPLGDWRAVYFHELRSHAGGAPQGGNVTAGDGSTGWVPFTGWRFKDVGYPGVPIGYDTLYWGHSTARKFAYWESTATGMLDRVWLVGDRWGL